MRGLAGGRSFCRPVSESSSSHPIIYIPDVFHRACFVSGKRERLDWNVNRMDPPLLIQK